MSDNKGSDLGCFLLVVIFFLITSSDSIGMFIAVGMIVSTVIVCETIIAIKNKGVPK